VTKSHAASLTRLGQQGAAMGKARLAVRDGYPLVTTFASPALRGMHVVARSIHAPPHTNGLPILLLCKGTGSVTCATSSVGERRHKISATCGLGTEWTLPSVASTPVINAQGGDRARGRPKPPATCTIAEQSDQALAPTWRAHAADWLHAPAGRSCCSAKPSISYGPV